MDARLPLQQLLSHLYVLVPVLDNDKHYWVGDDEVNKLLRHGEGWLAVHPEREAITRRYLKQQRSLVDAALAQLVDENEPDPNAAAEAHALEEEAIECSISLNELRYRKSTCCKSWSSCPAGNNAFWASSSSGSIGICDNSAAWVRPATSDMRR